MIVLVAWLAGYQAGLRDIPSKGGTARGEALSGERLREIARKGGAATKKLWAARKNGGKAAA